MPKILELLLSTFFKKFHYAIILLSLLNDNLTLTVVMNF